MKKSILNDIYNKTEFVIFNETRFLYFYPKKQNLKLKRFLNENKANNFAIITGWNPISKKATNSQNRKMNEKLKSLLKKNNFRFFLAQGRSPKGDFFEDSVAVLDIKLIQARKIGKIFNQNAILYYTKDKTPSIVWVTGY